MGFYAVAGWQPLSDTGAILAGGSLEFYTTGTSTPKAVYTNKALTSGSATSRTLDANGRVTANIFMLEDEGYRVICKNSSGTTIWTRDEQFGLALAVDESTARKRIVRTPLDNGAVGDGSTDDTTAVQAALTAAAGKVLDLAGLTYKCTGTLLWDSGTTIRNGKLLFTSAVSTRCLLAGGVIGTSQALSANAAVGATAVVVSAIESVAAQSLILLSNSGTTWGGGPLAQLEYVKSVSGTTINLSSSNRTIGGSALGAYNTADSSDVKLVTPVTDVRLEDVTIEVQSTAGAVGVDFMFCERVSVRNVRFILGASAIGMRIWGSSGVSVDGCTFAANSTSGFTNAVALRDTTREVSISDCVVRRATVAFSIGGTQVLGGICRSTTIRDCSTELGDSAIVMNAGSLDLAVSGCHFSGGNNSSSNVDLIDIAGYGFNISDCEISDPVRHWIRIHHADNTTGIHFTTYSVDGCVFSGSGSSGSLVLADPANAASVDTMLTINGNSFMGGIALGNAIHVGLAGAGDFQSVNITNNDFSGTTISTSASVILLAARDSPRVNISGNTVGYVSAGTGITVSSGTPDFLLIANNMLAGSGGVAAGINITSASVATITGNVILTSGDGILLDECANFHISGNRINATLQGIEIDNTDQEFTGGVISGNHIIAGDDAIEVDASDATGSIGLVISGNYLQSGGGAGEYVINISGIITGITITGNSCNRTNDTDDNINIAGDAAGNITQCTVSSNFLRNGAYGIDVSNNATTYHVGNSFESMATGNTNGTFAATLIST